MCTTWTWKPAATRDIEREDAVLSLPTDRVVRTNFNRDITLDLSSEGKEYDQAHYPLAALFDSTRHGQWRRGYQRQHRHADAKLDLFDHFEEDVLDAIKRYRVPAIELTRGTSKEAVCQVFEKVNTGGVPLTVFELMTATFAADNFDLRQDWAGREKRLSKQGVLRSVEATDFLQAVTLLTSHDQHQTAGTAISCKRRNILNLKREQYCANAARIEWGFFAAARLLVREKVFDARNLPYRTQLVPLASICAVLGDRFESDGSSKSSPSGTGVECSASSTEGRRRRVSATTSPTWSHGSNTVRSHARSGTPTWRPYVS